MTSLQSKFLFIGGLLLMTKLFFLFLIYIIAKKIEKRAKALKAMEAKEGRLRTDLRQPTN